MASPKIKAIAVGLGILLILGLVSAGLAYEQVPEGHEGVTKSWGAVTGETLEPGAHFKIPVMQSVQSVETRPRTYTMTNTQGEGQVSQADAITVKTVNGSSVDVDVTVRYRIDNEKADTFVTDWNTENQMEQRLIRPTIRSDLRDEASDIQTSDIYTQQGREALTETAKLSLQEEFSDEPIVLEEVQVRNIDLPESIDKALDQKEEAKQRVQVEQERVKQERQKKQQRIVRAEAKAEEVRIAAEADAKATKIRGEALQDFPIVLDQQEIEALEQSETIYVPVGDGTGLTLTKEVRGGNTTQTPQ